MRTRILRWVAVGALALGVVGCGDDATPDTTTADTAVAGDTTAPGTDTPDSTTAETAPPGETAVESLTFWHYWDGLNGEVIGELAERYAEETGVTVEPAFFGYGDLLTKLQTAGGTEEGPDVAIADLVWMPQLAESGTLVALDGFADAAGTDVADFFPELLDINTYGGELYGLPVSTNNLELFYNKELFDDAGLDPDAPPTNWDELTSMSESCADPDTGVTGMELYTEPGEGLTWQFQVYLWQAGGEFLNADNTAAAFNTPEGEAALQYWKDLLANGGSSLAPWGQFGQGTACMVMDGSWMVGIWSADPPFEFGTASMPSPADGSMATNMGGEQGFVMAEDAATQQAAFDFLAWLTSPEIQIEWDQRTGFMPVRSAVATDAGYLDYVESNEARYLPFVENQQYARSRPAVSSYPEISDVFSRALEQALVGDATAADALAIAEEAVNSVLSGG